MDAKPQAQQLLKEALRKPPGPWEWLLEGLAFLAMVATWAVLLVAWPHLPEQVPTHFDVTGQPDAFGPRSSLWQLAGVQLALWVGFTLMIHLLLPRGLINWPMEITEVNAPRVAVSIRGLLRGVNAFTAILFGFLLLDTVLIGLGRRTSLAEWLLPTALVVPPFLLAASLAYGLSGPDATAKPGGNTGDNRSAARGAAAKPSSPSGGPQPTRRQVLGWGLLVLALLTLASWIPLWIVPAWGWAPQRATGLAAGIALVLAGLTMPFVPPNPWIGIRTHRTLSDRRLWTVTHRWSSLAWIAGGVLLIALSAADWNPAAAILVIVGAVVVVSVALSHIAATRLREG